LRVKRQIPVPIIYKRKALNKVFYMDMLVNDLVPLELKSVEFLLPVHEVQLVTYLKLSGKKLGLLLNFNVEVMKNGIRRKINGQL
jgi:GxxExxY protein